MDGLYDYLLCTKCHFLKSTVITDFALLVRFEQLGDRGRSHCHVHQPPCLLLLHRSLSWVLITHIGLPVKPRQAPSQIVALCTARERLNKRQELCLGGEREPGKTWEK